MGAQNDAGVLDGNEELTPLAKDRFIKLVLDNMKNGPDADSGLLPCFPPSPRVENPPDLYDEELFAEWHSQIFSTYKDIAKTLNVGSAFPLAPLIQDPTALASFLELTPPDLSFPDQFLAFMPAIPLIAFLLDFNIPIELLNLLPNLPLPKVPPFEVPDILTPEKIPISVEKPDLLPPSVTDFAELALLKAWPIKLPTAFGKIIASFLSPPGIIQLVSFQLDPICDGLAAIFGNSEIPDSQPIQAATQKALLQVTGESTSFAVVAQTIGTSPVGVVGGVAKAMGYIPPEQETFSRDWVWSKTSISRWNGVNPRLKKVFDTALTISKYDIAIASGKRTLEEQTELLNNGSSNTLESKHLIGEAVDILLYREDGTVADSTRASDRDLYYYMANLIKEIAISENIGVQWGGSWQILNADPDEAKVARDKEQKRAQEAGERYLDDIGHYNIKEIA